MAYVDGFVIPIPKKNIKAYKKMAELGCKTWMKYGAISYFECVGDDLKTKMGLPFPKMCKLKSGETVVFAYIVFKSKTHRDQVNKKVMKYFDSLGEEMPMLFDMKRFAYGGFKVLVQD